ncbi:hypothetical protein GLOIN_2v1506894 [Rhizophagus irregularis DAOM 181602=DAOM 197198]|nr:hypothetical protein GLOIN_2v1506894 [Rhizophagus irregularis DAOM 181602=DAOM 197198]
MTPEELSNDKLDMIRHNQIKNYVASLCVLVIINTPDGFAQAERKACHLVLPNDQPKKWKNAEDASVSQVLLNDENDRVQEHRNFLPIVVDKFINSNRCYIANSLEFEIHDKDQEDYISYIKEKLIGNVEEVIDYGFDHIIIIRKLYYGLLFLDCFSRVFNLDFMTNSLFFYENYLKGVKRVTNGLEIKCAQWIVDCIEKKIVEVDYGNLHYLIPLEKKYMKEKKKKSSRKKRSKKKYN